MATNPVKGNLCQGLSFKQGEVKLLSASGSMWTKPVERITPAAKAFTMKNMSFSGLRAEILLPSKGRLTPRPPEIRTEAIEPSLYFRASPAAASLFLRSDRSQEQPSPEATAGKTMMRNAQTQRDLKMEDEEEEEG